MIDIALDPLTDDLDVGAYDLKLVTELDAFAQNLRIGLDFQKGEWELDITEGIPYRDHPEGVKGRVFVRGPKLQEIDVFFRTAIMATPGATRLTTFELDFDNESGELSLVFDVESIYGALAGSSVADNVLSLTTALVLTPAGDI